ncbi:MAG: GNAT family N-acetyltransferase, partial [Candidatus Kariarchaeaceae archaeon]|jgi:GNAT superfamily N-acetyltransferase
LADVYIEVEHRGRGLAKWLVKEIMEHQLFKTLRNWVLFTKDAHELYHQFGWGKLENPDRLMVKRKSAKDLYLNSG